MDYKIPTMAEVPPSHDIYIVETQEPTGPYGAKSVGELGINAVAAAVANGIVEATGARLTQLPLSAERVYQALYPQDFA